MSCLYSILFICICIYIYMYIYIYIYMSSNQMIIIGVMALWFRPINLLWCFGCRNRIWKQSIGHFTWRAVELGGSLYFIQLRAGWHRWHMPKKTMNWHSGARVPVWSSVVTTLCFNIFNSIICQPPSGDLHYACRAHHYCHFLPQAWPQHFASAVWVHCMNLVLYTLASPKKCSVEKHGKPWTIDIYRLIIFNNNRGYRGPRKERLCEGSRRFRPDHWDHWPDWTCYKMFPTNVVIRIDKATALAYAILCTLVVGAFSQEIAPVFSTI